MSERPANTQKSGSIPVLISYTAISIGSDGDEAIFVNRTGASIKITGARILADAAVTGNDTNYFTLSIINKEDDAGGTTTVASLAFTLAVNIVNWVPKALTLSTTAADLIVDVNEILTLEKVETASGIALPIGKVALEYEFV